MILLALLIPALVISLLTGGRITRLAEVHLRHSYLIPLALGIQVMIFSAWWHRQVGASLLSDALYILSLALTAVFCALNWRVPGVLALGLGLMLNAAVILANGGHMPASLQALRIAGIVDSREAFEAMRITNSSLIDATTPLWFLGDVFAVPKQAPLANVFSIGDVLIGVGACWFLWANMRVPGNPKEE